MTAIYTQILPSPLGNLVLQATDTALLALYFNTIPQTIAPNKITQYAALELSNYFKGTLQQFTVPLAPMGTPFQQKVWTALQHITFGRSISYLQLSKNLGDVKAIRAVGTANGKNPIPLIIPCHRVVGSKGELVGYSGELWRKEWLLQHEGLWTKNIFM